MKATMNANGRITIRAENDLEQYALRKWWDDWQEKKSGLQVELVSEFEPNVIKLREVKPGV